MKLICAMLCLCAAVCRADPCDPPTGWSGEVVAETPNGLVTVTTDQLYFAAYNAQQYIFSFLPDAHRITVPFDSVMVSNLDPATCTYYFEYQDDVFEGSFE